MLEMKESIWEQLDYIHHQENIVEKTGNNLETLGNTAANLVSNVGRSENLGSTGANLVNTEEKMVSTGETMENIVGRWVNIEAKLENTVVTMANNLVT